VEKGLQSLRGLEPNFFLQQQKLKKNLIMRWKMRLNSKKQLLEGRKFSDFKSIYYQHFKR
jgi:hypothetical protein